MVRKYSKSTKRLWSARPSGAESARLDAIGRTLLTWRKGSETGDPSLTLYSFMLHWFSSVTPSAGHSNSVTKSIAQVKKPPLALVR